ncbi:MAG TPA: hypothetical protein DCK87_06245 [Desulfotomaculum sp.]|nr:hypothetical protein [Desulfotomaculum sp.]
MESIEKRVPFVLTELPFQERKIILTSVVTSVKLRMAIVQKKLKQARARLSEFEAKYKCTFEQFEKGFPEKASLEHHEDYVEWGFWYDVSKESKAILDTYCFFLGEGK